MTNALRLGIPPTLTQKTAQQDTNDDPACLELMPRVGHAEPLVHAIGQAILGELQAGGLVSARYLESLFRTLTLSPYHFARKFNAAAGLPPYQYVLHCRVEQAKPLLTAGEHSISEVAQAVGFASQSHLTRYIKQTFGVTPGALLPERKNRQK